MKAGVNEYGTPVLVVESCEGCGRDFTVCPLPPPEKWENWKGCLADFCPTYDIERDVDLFWDALSKHGLIERD